MRGRNGEVLGTHLQKVIQAMPASEVALGNYSALADDLDPNGWYDWNLFVTSTHAIAARLPSDTLIEIGKRLVHTAEELLVQQGFDSLDKVMSDWSAVFRANTRGVPDIDWIQTAAFERGHVVIEFSDAHVPEMVEGYMRGFVELFDNTVTAFQASLRSKSPRIYCYDMRYLPAAKVVAVR